MGAEGAEFAITPYVGSLLKCMGPVAGIVGAGGNVGAVCWLNIYKALNQTSDDARLPFLIHGVCCLALAIPIIFVHFAEFGSMFLPKTKELPEHMKVEQVKITKDAEAAEPAAPQEGKV